MYTLIIQSMCRLVELLYTVKAGPDLTNASKTKTSLHAASQWHNKNCFIKLF